MEVRRMLLGLDHVVIAVSDLSAGMARLESTLGLTVIEGGEHPGAGTHNAVARFGAEYLELISVHNPVEARATAARRNLLEFLDRGEGLLGYALASDDLERDVAEASARGLQLEGPVPGSRKRPDGSVISWKKAGVPGDPWGRKLPFLIQHETSIEERRSWAPKEGHRLGTTGIPLLSVAVNDLDGSADAYRRLLGEPPEVVEEVPALPARRARFQVGCFRVELLQPMAKDGGLADFVRREGDALFMVSFAVPDVDRAVAALREFGTSVANPTFRRRAPLLQPAETLGARFQLVEQS